MLSRGSLLDLQVFEDIRLVAAGFSDHLGLLFGRAYLRHLGGRGSCLRGQGFVGGAVVRARVAIFHRDYYFFCLFVRVGGGAYCCRSLALSLSFFAWRS